VSVGNKHGLVFLQAASLQGMQRLVGQENSFIKFWQVDKSAGFTSMAVKTSSK